LPHRLIEAFKATLEEAIVADFLIHVIDLSSPECEAHVLTTREVLAELGAADKPTLTVLNKVDKPVDPILRKTVHALCPGAIEVSLVTGQGLGELTGRISDLVCSTAQPLRVCIPHDQYTWVRHIHEHCSIVAEAAHPEGVYFDLVVPARWVAALRPFEVQHFPPPL
jgi:GTP-binding protein HflX